MLPIKKIECYDSDMESINPDQFESDLEPPSDKIFDIRLIKKFPLKRYHKQILKIGTGIDKPAKYDEIQIKYRKNVNHDLKNNFKDLSSEPIQNIQIGFNQINEPLLEETICEMKKGEIILFIIEYLKIDQSNLKVLDYSEYSQIELVDWVTVIDLFQDFNYMKKIIQKGVGNHRYELSDEISFSYTIKYIEDVIIKETYKTPTQFIKIANENQNILDQNIIKILQTMKEQEICETKVSRNVFVENSNSSEIQTKIKQFSSNIDSSIYVNIKLKKLIKIEDIFNNQLCFKKLLIKARNSDKPELNSQVYFNYQIYYESLAKNLLLFSSVDQNSTFENFCQFNKCEQQDDYLILQQQQNQIQILYLDEYKISRFLKQAIKTMGKEEISEYKINYGKMQKYFKYGEDTKIIKDFLYQYQIKANSNIILTFYVKIHYFTEGLNTFLMNVEQKIQQAERKKEIGVWLISNEQYKYALKIFHNINTFFDLGKFSENEIFQIKKHKLSSLLNTSLCNLKLKKFKECIQVCNKILEIDHCNVKALYRKCFSLNQLLEYQQTIQLINDFFQKNNSEYLKNQQQQLLGLLEDAKINLLKYLNKEKVIYKNLFSQKD